MAKLTEETLWHSEFQNKFLELAPKIGSDNEIILMAFKGNFKEYLFLTDEQVYIIKEGYLTGNMFGNSVFNLPYNNIASIEMKLGFGGVGFLEISANGVKNVDRSYWSTDAKSDPAKAPNCVTLSKSTKNDFQMAINKINELKGLSTKSPTNFNSSLDEIKKLKELLDLGALTQEEFDLKKKQLLGV